jgi:hypothetical protein
MKKLLKAELFHWAVAAILATGFGLVYAADMGMSKDETHVFLKGEIQPGDFNKLVTLARRNFKTFLHATWSLDSTDGDVQEAMQIGNLIKNLGRKVEVGEPGAKCASACFLVYASAVDRIALENSLGLRKPYLAPAGFGDLSPDQTRKKSELQLTTVRDFLTENEVPTELIEKMFSLSPDQIYWLDAAEAERLGRRPHWFDQNLMAKCRFSSKQFFEAIGRVEKGAASERSKVQQWTECQDGVQEDMSMQNFDKVFAR